MSSEGSAEWELSKENIQPLKKGRKVEKLVQDPRVIESERQTYEANLRSYKGSDPLKPWIDYILWLEQTFPKGGSEGGLNTLLSKCMTEFKSNPVCNQDPRYLDVWIKYANISSKPLDCYNYMYREKLCTECSGFYIAWANQLEESGQCKRAEVVYKSALSKEFSPEEKEALIHKRNQFETRVAKKVMEDLATESTTNNEEGGSSTEERQALARLKGRGKKQAVGSIRIGSAKLDSCPGYLAHQDAEGGGNAHRPKFSVLDENPLPELNVLPPSEKGHLTNDENNLPCTPSQNAENEMNAGKWTVGKKKSLMVPHMGSKPTFEIHHDDGIEEQHQPVSTPCKIGGTPALSTKKRDKESSSVVPVALFEPFDPSIRPMYCKHLIYQGVSEISFEELRAIPFLQKMKEEKALDELMQVQKKTLEDAMRKQEMMYNEKLGMLQSEIAQMKEKLNQSDTKVMTSSLRNSSRGGENASNSSSSKVYEGSNDNTPNKIGDDTKSLLQGYDGSSKESSQLTCNSPTMNLIKNMWVSPSASNPSKPKIVPQGGGEESCKKSMPFKVHTDEDDLPKKKPAFEIFTDDKPVQQPSSPPRVKPSFEIFQDLDEEEKESPAMPPPPPLVSKGSKAFQIFQDPADNDVPQAGGTPAEESGRRVVNELPKPELVGETTMVITSLEDFAAKAVVSSTPAFGGKRFLPDDDENTCAVPLLFKKPEVCKQPEPELPSMSNNQPSLSLAQDLSTIMETSREYKSSSSSSGSSAYLTTAGGLTSHFGNTLQTMDSVETRGGNVVQPLLQANNNETGYAGDTNSTSKTPLPPPGKRPCLKDTPRFCVVPTNDDDEDDDRFGEIMSNFERVLEKRRGDSSSLMADPKEQNSFFQQSLKASFQMERSAFQGGGGDSLFQSHLSPSMNMSSPQLDCSEAGPQADEESLLGDLTDKMKGVLVQAPLYDLSNPFDEKIQRDILRSLSVPLSKRPGFVSLDELLPKIAPHKMIKIKESFFGIKSLIGEGVYGKIFKAVRHNNEAVNDTICEMSLVFKVQKPAREWEFYIVSEVQSRLHNFGSFMSIPRCYSYSDGSIFVSEYLPATLLDVLNASKKLAEESYALFFVIQLCELVQRLGCVKIIHGDIKPDNIMLRRKPSLNCDAKSVEEMFPSSSEDPYIQLIDFGRGIDMALCKEGTTFTHVFKSKDTLIPEMLKGKPWSYQIDYFGIASTAYCLKFGSYMNLVERNGVFSHSGHYKRWWNAELWTEFYAEFLNIESQSCLPDLSRWKKRFEIALFNKNVAANFNRTFKEIETFCNF